MLRLLELSWMIIAMVGAFFGAFKWATECLSSAIWFFLIAAVGLILWSVRRKQRIRMETTAQPPEID